MSDTARWTGRNSGKDALRAEIWQTLETKARFIQQMRSGDVTIREIDDISEVVLSAAEIKAIASGNPKVIPCCSPTSMKSISRNAHLVTYFWMVGKQEVGLPR